MSNDRLLRVRSTQSSHLYTGDNGDDSFDSGHQKKVNSGDMCVFKRIDCEKVIIGRVIQFSYLDGGKRERQYSSSYVDMSLESHKNIGVFANWFKKHSIFLAKQFLSNRMTLSPLVTFRWIDMSVQLLKLNLAI